MDIVLQIQGTVDSTTLHFDYSASIMCKDQAANLAETFRKTLFQLLHKPHSSLRELDLCSTHDIDQLKRWNNALPDEKAMCVHEVILERCLQYPSNVAVSSWDGDLTYHDLETPSSQLAGRLVALGAGPESFVSLCFEKSKWAIVAVLGVLRAGGAYAFLDPSSPFSRMTSICQDLDARLMVCSTMHSEIGDILGLRTVVVPESDTLPDGKGYRPQLVHPSVGPRNAVYAAFTPGSTGKPKGVIIEPGGFHLMAMANGPTLSLNSQSRVLQFANYVFDVSNRDILYTLMFGGCLCIPSDF